MQSEEEAVCAAAMQFYDAIEQMALGKGLDAMDQAWHHTDGVTSGHPSGDWAEGWDQVWATWQVFAAFGAEGRGGTQVRDLKARVYGDIAYTMCTFIAAPAFGGERLACTNVLARIGGAWKLVHHHADKSLAMGAALEKLVGG